MANWTSVKIATGILGALLTMGIGPTHLQGDSMPSRLVAIKSGFTFNEQGIWETEVQAGMEWTEAVVSWNAAMGPEGKLTIQASPGDSGEWFTLGIWSDDKLVRQSMNDQKSEVAEVKTDTLVTASLQTKLKVRLIGDKADVELVTVCFANPKASTIKQPDLEGVWGTVLEPPRRAQMSYPNGNVICSATATSMLLGYWAEKLERPELDRDVPLVCEGVFDPKWPGTGNWPFNTAYAGSLPGMRGYVARLWSIPQLEAWIARGIPVACSVSRMMLQGEPKGKNDGHLVVLVGFTKEGDPVFNDPGRNVVRMTYKRADFAAAWASSGRTCYLVHPELYQPPENRDDCWVE